MKYLVASGIKSFSWRELEILSGNISLDTFKNSMVFFAPLGTKKAVQAEPGGKT